MKALDRYYQARMRAIAAAVEAAKRCGLIRSNKPTTPPMLMMGSSPVVDKVMSEVNLAEAIKALK